MSKNLYIDASHPNETRVVLKNENHIEDYEYESINNTLIKNNIYLGKVSRIEPSLQAAFVDFGRERHGFLSFNDIQSDYYQIPQSDLEKIKEEEEKVREELSKESENTENQILEGNEEVKLNDPVEKLEDAVMATTSSHEFGMKKWRAYQSLEQSVKVTTTGSDCYNYGLLASGHIDIVAERLSFPHDYLPLIKIVEGAGGIMTDWEGKKLNFDQSNVYVLASASKQIHEQALSKLQ